MEDGGDKDPWEEAEQLSRHHALDLKRNTSKKLQILWGLFKYLPTKTIQCELFPLSALGNP